MKIENAVEIEGLTKIYQKSKAGLLALDKVDFIVPRGSFFGLLGPNGAGKSTLINIIAGVVNKTEGRVAVCGYDIETQLREAKCSIGIVPQEVNLDPFFTVQEILELYSGFYGIRNNAARIKELLHILRLENKKNDKPRQLSGGMMRRLLIAKALVHSPEVVVLDEPTAGVDIELRHQLWEYIKEINSMGTTIILTTHYFEEAEKLCDRIAIINRGKIIENDTKANLFKRLNHKEIIITTSSQIDTLPQDLIGSGAFLNDERQIVLQYNSAGDHLNKFMSLISSLHIDIKDIATNEASLEEIYQLIAK